MSNLTDDTLSLFGSIPNISKRFCKYLMPCGQCELRNAPCDVPYNTRINIMKELRREDNNIDEDY